MLLSTILLTGLFTLAVLILLGLWDRYVTGKRPWWRR